MLEILLSYTSVVSLWAQAFLSPSVITCKDSGLQFVSSLSEE